MIFHTYVVIFHYPREMENCFMTWGGHFQLGCGIYSKSQGICISITENIVPHGRHFLPLEKVSTLRESNFPWASSLYPCFAWEGKLPSGKGFHSVGNFFHMKKMPATWYYIFSCGSINFQGSAKSSGQP